MAKRVSQAPVEVLYTGSPKHRVSQAMVEVLYTGSPKHRVSQAMVEVLYTEGTAPVTATPRFWAQVIG